METEKPRQAGRPRSERARQAILIAALDLASENGAEGLTMSGIAVRAGVSKETLYRWWPAKGEVLLEALADLGERTIPISNSVSLRSDLHTFMRATAQALDPPTRRLLRTLAAGAATDSRFADQVRESFLDHRRAALAAILDHAVQRGELDQSRVEITLDLVFGSLWYRLIFANAPLDKSWADAVTQAITAAAQP